MAVNDALRDWARLPAAARVLATAREKMEHGGRGARVVLSRAEGPEERVQLGRLLGLTWQHSGRPVTIGLLQEACRAQHCDLGELLVLVGGPLVDRVAIRADARAEVDRMFAEARKDLVEAGLAPRVVDLAVVRHWAGSRSSPHTAELLGALAGIWPQLPAPGSARMLAEFASATTPGPHGLDRSSDLGRLAARCLAAQGAVEDGDDDLVATAAAAATATAEGWRNAWSRGRVVCDRVSSTVLVLNLPLVGSAAALDHVNVAARQGEPVWLTARSLVGDWSPAKSQGVVRVCENPSVVEAAADRLGAGSAALVCTFGRPSLAAWTLLGRLDAQGTRLLISADRDRAGRQIEAGLLAGLGNAERWVCDGGGDGGGDGVYEEDRWEGLLADLAR